MKAEFTLVMILGLISATGVAMAAPEGGSDTDPAQVKPQPHPAEKGTGPVSTAKEKQRAEGDSAPAAKSEKKKTGPYSDKSRHYHPRDAK